MELQDWMRGFVEWHGVPLPDSYLIFDTETTGLSRKEDLPIDFGWMIVRDGEPIDRGSVCLDWTLYPDLVHPDWLKRKLDNVVFHLRQKGFDFPYTVKHLAKHGKDPADVFEFCHKLFEANREAGCEIVGFNIIHFDCPLFSACFEEFLLGEPYDFGSENVYDIGLLHKAFRGGISPELRDRGLGEFFSRVYNIKREGLRWNAETCAAYYQMESRHNVNLAKLHQAGNDVVVAYHLFEEIKACAAGATK